MTNNVQFNPMLIQFRPSDFVIKQLADGTPFVALRNGFSRSLINEMRNVYGVENSEKYEETEQ